MMAFKGVRNSWLILARNRDFAWFIASARARPSAARKASLRASSNLA